MAKKQAGFDPTFRITPQIARGLMRIEAMKQAIEPLPLTPRVLKKLRETARLVATHYSTVIEGNLLTKEQVAKVIRGNGDFPGRERDQDEVRGYYDALDEVDRLAKKKAAITKEAVQRLHALLMRAAKTRVRATAYRDGQNVIRDSLTGRIVSLPPESKDVPVLMEQLIAWLRKEHDFPVPLKAAITHYQVATIHPYYDGNGRLARLLTTLILHSGGYGLKGLYALEEYYARDLRSYYEALTIGPSHNNYLGRAESDITSWVAYCIGGMAEAFEKVYAQARRAAKAGQSDQSQLIRGMTQKQRTALTLFESSRDLKARDIGGLLGLRPRSASALCQMWVAEGFLVVADAAKKSRRYRLAEKFESLIVPA